jgi:DNA-directed RNA polymerase specialized sigma24 family protein
MDTTETDARDQADMARLAAGHDAALNDLMERHAVPVFRLLCRMLNNEDDANDLAQ